MKINWGTGIVLAFIAFIAFILYFVVRMSLDDRANHDLVSDAYYHKELAYQSEIDAERTAMEDKVQLNISTSLHGVRVEFPEGLHQKEITGTVSLYRPSNKHLDFDFPISLSNTHLLIPDNRLLGGRWDITVKWNYKGKTFLHKQKINY